MVRIVYEEGLEAIAKRIAQSAGGDIVKLENAIEAPGVLEEVDSIGLVYCKCGKDISTRMVRFIKESLSAIDLKGLEYLFSICVCQRPAKPQYALKVVNGLCSQIGCLPSYSKAVPSDGSAGDAIGVNAIEQVCNDISKEAIRLADGSPFIGLYMKANKKRFEEA